MGVEEKKILREITAVVIVAIAINYDYYSPLYLSSLIIIIIIIFDYFFFLHLRHVMGSMR